ncbi:MAG: SET domain-containing protein [Bdellovibrionales bacterium]|nr:SET domain-containing protein [Bdellovibrionales bacterium]
MILPSLRIKWISDDIGYGLFATEFIPKGTVTYAFDPLEIVLPRKILEQEKEPMRSMIDKYSYEDNSGNLIICWDLGKFMNHCCYSNTLTTGYVFGIAINDIQPGEEVTDDYRIFTRQHGFQPSCEKFVCPVFSQSQEQVEEWDGRIKDALKHFAEVPQPLKPLIPAKMLKAVEAYLRDPAKYVSVGTQLPKANPSASNKKRVSAEPSKRKKVSIKRSTLRSTRKKRKA